MGYQYILKPLSTSLCADVFISIACEDLSPIINEVDEFNIQTYLLERILNAIMSTERWNEDVITNINIFSMHVLEIDNLYMSNEKIKMPETIDELHRLLDAIDFIFEKYKYDYEVFDNLQMLFIRALPINDKTARLIYSHIKRRG